MQDAGNSSQSPLNQAINNFGVLSGTTLDQSQGALQKTGNDLDLAIEGSGYFVVQTAEWPHVHPQRQLSGIRQGATDHQLR